MDNPAKKLESRGGPVFGFDMSMTLEEFTAGAESGEPLPKAMTPELQSLWLAKAGDWHGSHEIAQDIGSKMGSAIHGYLHRVEGDIWNANYWYSRAGRPNRENQEDLDEEWAALVEENL